MGRLTGILALFAGSAVTALVLGALVVSAADLTRLFAGVGPGFVRSLLVAAWTLVFLFVTALPGGIWLYWGRAGRRAARLLVDGTGALPSVVVGLVGLMLFVRALGLGFSLLAASLTLTAVNLPFALRRVEEAARRHDGSFAAALALGAPRGVAFFDAVWPHMGRPLFTAAVDVAARTMGETTALVLTLGAASGGPVLDPLGGGPTLSLRLFNLLAAGRDGLYGLTSATAFLMMGVGLLLYVAARIFREGGRRS